jgi:hypothetical protein
MIPTKLAMPLMTLEGSEIGLWLTSSEQEKSAKSRSQIDLDLYAMELDLTSVEAQFFREKPKKLLSQGICETLFSRAELELDDFSLSLIRIPHHS